MKKIQTNRDLYIAIEKLTQDHKVCERSLEQYLLALLLAAKQYEDLESISLNEFYELISQSFSTVPHGFDDNWRNQYEELPVDDSGFTGFQATLIRQIVDLREMNENHLLNNELRYFGIMSPRNSQWFNFDPAGYLECATAGSFSGWEPGDNTGRGFVNGPVAVFSDDLSVQEANTQDLPRPQYEISAVTWEQFKDFVYCGQIYE